MATPPLSTRALQQALNRFTNRYLDGVTPLRVDGERGQATDKRVRQVKRWLGYVGNVNDTVDLDFRQRLAHPKNVRYSTPARIRRGMWRRSRSRAAWRRNMRELAGKPGLVRYDGKMVPKWIVAQLTWAREVGYNGKRWDGSVVSGTRTPAFSESLCFNMCGEPRCPGRCAGRSSNHNSDGTIGTGAVDLTDYLTFAELMPHCPDAVTGGHRLRNDLPNDRVHFSESGH